MRLLRQTGEEENMEEKVAEFLPEVLRRFFFKGLDDRSLSTIAINSRNFRSVSEVGLNG